MTTTKYIAATVLVSLMFASSLNAQTRTAYQNTVSSQNPSNYFKLDGSLTDSVDGSLSLVSSGSGVAPVPDAYGNSSSSYAFQANTDYLKLGSDIIKGGGSNTNGAAAGKGSITLMFRALDGPSTGQRYVFAQGTNASTGNMLSLFFESNSTNVTSWGDLKLRAGTSTVSLLSSNDVVYDCWYYFAMTWDESRDNGEVLWYLGRAGGVLSAGTNDIGNDEVLGDNGNLTLGNRAEGDTGGYNNPGRGRVDEFAVWQSELSYTEITNQFSKLPNYYPVGASYPQVVQAQFPAYFFQLNNSLTNSTSPALTLTANAATGFFTNDFWGNPSFSYALVETNDALYITNDLVNGGGPAADGSASAVGSIAFLFRTLADTNNTGQRYLFSQGTGTSGNYNQLSVFLENTNGANGDPNSMKLRVGNGPTTTILNRTNIQTNTWYYFAMTYDEARNSQSGGEIRYYLGPAGGTLVSGSVDINNSAVVGDNGWVVLGNRTSTTDVIQNNAWRNPGEGRVDEFATYNDELSPSEIAAQFSALVPQTVVQPVLSIERAGTDVLISWPVAGSSGFALEGTVSLSAPSWGGAGTPAVVGTNNIVTNAATGGGVFYRLHKP